MGGKDFIDREAIGTIWQAAKPALHMPSGPASFEISIMEKHGIRLPQTRGLACLFRQNVRRRQFMRRNCGTGMVIVLCRTPLPPSISLRQSLGRSPLCQDRTHHGIHLEPALLICHGRTVFPLESLDPDLSG